MHVVLLTWQLLLATGSRLRTTASRSRTDNGASTLELVILILGLISVATLLVGVLLAAVKSRTDQIQ